MADAGTKSQPPSRCLPLTPYHRQHRLDFCQSRASCRNKSRFCLNAYNQRISVWRRPGQIFDLAFVAESHTAITQNVTVWGAICWDTQSLLLVFQQTLVESKYVDGILTPVMLPMLSCLLGAI
ncbi:HTH_Tnp_Tc3_2 domain-containing protein [Trichonephila clavipes]|nr:HTH_Tnp_Tc3_2 domain-containing protein [Trichonephila clavipes]